MKKITITTTRTGFNGDETYTYTRSDYVSDDYLEDDYYIDRASRWNSRPIDHESVNYTETLRDIHNLLDDFAIEMEAASVEVEDFAERIKADATLNESDREKLSSAISDAAYELGLIMDNCYGPAQDVLDKSLDAFKNLTLTK